MKRVLFVADNLFPLGIARSLVSRALERALAGDEVHLAAPFYPAHRDWLRDLPITIHDLPPDTNRHGLSGFDATPLDGSWFRRQSWKSVVQLRQLLRALKPASVEAAGEQAATWAGLAAMGLTEVRSGRVELVYHAFRMPPSQPRWGLPWLLRIGGVRFSKAILSHELLQPALADQQVTGTLEVAPVPWDTIRRIPYFQPAEPSVARNRLREHLGLSETTWIAGVVAPLIPRSRLKDLIWATDLLTVVRNDFHFVIFGSGSQHGRLKKYAGFTEAASHVHFVGQPEDAWLLFQGLDVFWQSHLDEPLPQNMLAAMSLGIPVISVLGKGTLELVKHQQTGFGVNFGARDEFARWTKYLIEQTESARMIQTQAREYLENQLKI